MLDKEVQINFDAPATLRKWPSLNNERVNASTTRTANCYWGVSLTTGPLTGCDGTALFRCPFATLEENRLMRWGRGSVRWTARPPCSYCHNIVINTFLRGIRREFSN